MIGQKFVKIKINKIEEDLFNVEVIDRRTSFHKVTITDKHHKDLTGGFISKIQLLEKSFEFLLDREPNTSILTNFEIQVISNYFSDYKKYILTWSKA